MEPEKSNTLTVLITFGVSVFVTLNQGSGVLNGIRILGLDLFNLFDTVASAFGLTLTGLFELAFAVFCMGFAKFRQEANRGAKGLRIWKGLKWHYNIILPIILCFTFYCVLQMYGLV